jgi:acetyl-CoA carboxylase carboxyltransferase component
MDINFNKNEDHNKLLLSDLKQRFAKVKLGGGEKRIEKLHAEGKMTARERIDYLLDAKANAIEIGAFVGDAAGATLEFIGHSNINKEVV